MTGRDWATRCAVWGIAMAPDGPLSFSEAGLDALRQRWEVAPGDTGGRLLPRYLASLPPALRFVTKPVDLAGQGKK